MHFLQINKAPNNKFSTKWSISKD